MRSFKERIFYLKTVLSKNRIRPEIKKKKAMSWSPMAKSSNFNSTNLDNNPIPKLNKSRIMNETLRYQL